LSSVTIRDVARIAGVSTATVSRVLNNSPVVRPETREKVLAVIADTGYRPNLTARRLSIGRTYSIGIVLPFLTLPSFVERLRGVQSVLADTEYDLVLVTAETPEKIEDCIDNLLSQTGVDGIIIVSITPTDNQVDQIEQQKMPVVLVDARQPKLDRVVVDDFSGGYKATRYLIDLGHRRIAFLSDYLDNPFNFVSMNFRFDGYRQALEEAGIPFRPDYQSEGELGGREAYEKARALLSLPEKPTSVFAASDTHAVGVLKAAHDLGIKVPEGLSVVGYDDIRDAEYLNLTTIRQHLFEMGVKGAQMLMTSLDGQIDSPRKISLPVELIVRGTTAKPYRDSMSHR
jgi:DNA-binding LacI/PurR family transcriptional regulator